MSNQETTPKQTSEIFRPARAVKAHILSQHGVCHAAQVQATAIDRSIYTQAWLEHTIAGCGTGGSFAQILGRLVATEMRSSDWDTMTAVDEPTLPPLSVAKNLLVVKTHRTIVETDQEVIFAGAWTAEEKVDQGAAILAQAQAEEHSSSAD